MNEIKIGDEVICYGAAYPQGIKDGEQFLVCALMEDCAYVIGQETNSKMEKQYGGYFNLIPIKYLSKITNKESKKIMQKLTSALKRVLSKSLQSQYKAGLRDGNLELTEEGKKELLEIIAQEKESELTSVADEINKENENSR